MPELKDQEERLKFLISRINSEISKFEKMLEKVERKQSDLNDAIVQKGLQKMPIEITPHSEEKESLYDELHQHVMDLNKLKNLITTRLEMVIKEEELIEGLKKEYGNKVQLEKLPTGEFELKYRDNETDEAFNAINTSKKLVAQLRESVEDLERKG